MVKVYNNTRELAKQLAKFLADAAINQMNAKRNLFVALSGGSTPKLLFKILADKYKDASWWKVVHFFWGDERMVPADSPESNYGEAKRILFDNILIPPENIHNVNGENDITNECNRYDCEIASYLQRENLLPVFDIVILGMGEDGHTASIFPNQIDLINSEGICEEAIHPVTGQKRLTLTGKVINNAIRVVFLVAGKDKAGIVSAIINKKDNYQDYPAAHINPETGNLLWMLDKEAARFI